MGNGKRQSNDRLTAYMRDTMIAKGVTQIDMAIASNHAQSYIAKHLSGTDTWRLDDVEAIAPLLAIRMLFLSWLLHCVTKDIPQAGASTFIFTGILVSFKAGGCTTYTSISAIISRYVIESFIVIVFSIFQTLLRDCG